MPKYLLAVTCVLAMRLAVAGEYIVDHEADCAVWNPHPVDNETIRWDGACVEGKASGSGIVHWFENNRPVQTVEGDYADGKVYGHGVLIWASGHRYEGEFDASEMHGFGVLIWPDGARYEGSYYRGMQHGAGRCFTPEYGWEPCRWFQGERIHEGLEA